MEDDKYSIKDFVGDYQFPDGKFTITETVIRIEFNDGSYFTYDNVLLKQAVSHLNHICRRYGKKPVEALEFWLKRFVESDENNEPKKKTFIVHAEKVATRSYEVEANSEQEAIDKVREELYPANPITADDFICDIDYYV
jgi:hypothetical protein